VLADSSKLPGKDSPEKALWLLEKSGVAAVPGRAFFRGIGGDNLLRFCFAKEDAVLSEACGRLSALRL
jgi:aminotransferase